MLLSKLLACVPARYWPIAKVVVVTDGGEELRVTGAAFIDGKLEIFVK
jgi:hypothetical protein